MPCRTDQHLPSRVLGVVVPLGPRTFGQPPGPPATLADDRSAGPFPRNHRHDRCSRWKELPVIMRPWRKVWTKSLETTQLFRQAPEIAGTCFQAAAKHHRWSWTSNGKGEGSQTCSSLKFRAVMLPFMQAGGDTGHVAGIEEGAELSCVRQRLEFKRIEMVRVFRPPVPALVDDGPACAKCPSASSTRRCLSGHRAIGSSFAIDHS